MTQTQKLLIAIGIVALTGCLQPLRQ